MNILFLEYMVYNVFIKKDEKNNFKYIYNNLWDFE